MVMREELIEITKYLPL